MQNTSLNMDVLDATKMKSICFALETNSIWKNKCYDYLCLQMDLGLPHWELFHVPIYE
jgi:hypothetical protein